MEYEKIYYEGYFAEGKISVRYSYLPNNHKKHISFYRSGKIKEIVYFKGLFEHKMDGPAIIRYDEFENITYQEFWYNGGKIKVKTLKQFKKIIKTLIIS